MDRKNKILEYIINNNLKIWNIDTDIFNSYNRFWDNLLKNKKDINNNNLNFNIKLCGFNKNKNPLFIIGVNDCLVTPNKNKMMGWSKAGIRQFLQIGVGLNYWNIDFKCFNKLKVIEDNYEIKLKPLFFDFFSNIVENESFEDTFIDHIMMMIQKAMISEITYVRNLGASIILSILYRSNVLKNSDNINALRKSKNKKHDNNLNKYDHIKKMYFESYKKVVDSILRKFKSQQIIKLIYSTIKTRIINILLLGEFDVKYKDWLDYIELERIKLRQNIIKGRYLNRIKCNDIINTKPNSFYIQDCDAAHIYEVSMIKLEVKRMIFRRSDELEIKKFIDSKISTIDNGILLPKNYHYLYDAGCFFFDENGRLIIDNNISEEKDDRLEIINIRSIQNYKGNIKINNNIMSNNMINNLKLRNN